ncbi:hypothetical protein [Luteococcus sp.]|uniref:hypothetical protein n=1 Tax=Luteococcus sp. TaxID=1969402 RepID=UPI003736344D
MSVFLLTAVSGAPGVSTMALGMALRWPRASLLVEADAQQSLLAGYFAGAVPPEPNLSQVAVRAARGEANLGEAIWHGAQRFPSDAEPNRRLFIPGPTPPWMRHAVDQRWGAMAPTLAQMDEAGMDVLVDLGRLQTPISQTPALVSTPLLENSALVAVVIEPTLPGIAAARILVEGLTVQVKHSVRQPLLGVVLRAPATASRRWFGPQVKIQTYSPREISRQLNVPVLGQVEHDVAGAALLNQGLEWDKSPLAKNLHSLARDLQQRATRHATSQENPHA